MPAIPVSEVRQRVRDALLGLEGGDVWINSRQHYDDWPDDETRKNAHKVFVVGALSTLPDTLDARQDRVKGVQSHTTIGVKLGYRIKADDVDPDTDEGLDVEALALVAVMAVSPLGGLHIRFDGIISRFQSLGLQTSELRFRMTHRVALS